MQVAIGEAKPKEKLGLKDGGHVYIPCSNCDAILMDVWRTMPDAINPHTGKTFFWQLSANCPFCGDKSYLIPVEGIFHPGGYGRMKEDNPEDDIPSTIIDNFTTDGDKVTFEIKKANENAKPFKR